MAGSTKQPDTVVAERLYCRQGKRVTTFFYKHADSTIRTNKWEQTQMLLFFGKMMPPAVTATMIYAYIEIRTAAGAGAVAVKEVALLSGVFEYCRRKGALQDNPCHGRKVEKTSPRGR